MDLLEFPANETLEIVYFYAQPFHYCDAGWLCIHGAIKRDKVFN
jgi:hypothetical protein